MRNLMIIFLGLALLLSPAHGAVSTQPPAAAGKLEVKVDLAKNLGSTEVLRNLLGGVGYGRDPGPELVGPLRSLGIRVIRFINVDVGTTPMVAGPQGRQRVQSPFLDRQLEWCRQVGATPHIIIGQKIPTWLSTYAGKPNFGPKDWQAYKNYIQAFMTYVIIDRGFRNASWEVANEPDISGAPVLSFPRGPSGGEKEYQSYLQIYRAISQVAQSLESTHNINIILGGPSGAGIQMARKPFDWYTRFIQDVARERLKCNFFSLHFYGNLSSLGRRQNRTDLLSFGQMMTNINGAIAKYRPGLPVWVTEWGPHSRKNVPDAILSANNVGASWTAAFVDEMLKYGVKRSILLRTTTPDIEGWPALFYKDSPLSIYHVFHMFQSLKGNLAGVQGGSVAVGALASRDGSQAAALLWNYNWERGRREMGREGARQEAVTLRFAGLPATPNSYRVTTTLVSGKYGLPAALSSGGASPQPLDTDLGLRTVKNGVLDLELSLPPSSVTLVKLSPAGSQAR